MTASALEPLKVYDIRDTPTWVRITADGDSWKRLLDWVRSQGLNPHEIYRLEVWLVDCPSARVYEYDRDEDGHRYAVGDEFARREPYDVILSSLPPEASAVPEEQGEL